MTRARRLALVDTAATVAFFTTVAALTELFVAGMEPREVLVTRLLTVPVMLLIGRPYGVWRDAALRRAPDGRAWRLAADVGAFLSFQVPVYAATLALAGADGGEVLRAVGAAVAFMVVLARPFGLFLDWVRRRAGVAAGQTVRRV